MTASPVPPNHVGSAVAVFGGGGIALAALIASLVGLSPPRTEHEFARDTQPETRDALSPLRPAPDALAFESVASVTDVAHRDDAWFVLDARNSEVHRFDQRGRHLHSFARRGDGPGELRRPRALAIHGDTVVVATPGRLHFYDTDGEHLLDRLIKSPAGCRDPRTGATAANLRDIASSPAGILLLFTCRSGDLRASVLIELSEAAFRELAHNAHPRTDDAIDPWREMSVLAAHPVGFAFGHADDHCLGIFDLDGRRRDTVCHEWLERHVVPSSSGLAEAQAAAARVGKKLVVPKRYLPFDRVFAQPDGTLIYRAPVPLIAAGDDVAMAHRLVAHDGAGGTELGVPVATTAFVSDYLPTALAAWDDPLGMQIAVYELDRQRRPLPNR